MTATTRAGGTTPPSGYVSVGAVLPGGLCPCHGEPVYTYKEPRHTAGVTYRCAVIIREKRRAYYDQMDGVTFNRKLLKQRRIKALKRNREREGRT